jgi:hypothetical protein
VGQEQKQEMKKRLPVVDDVPLVPEIQTAQNQGRSSLGWSCLE